MENYRPDNYQDMTSIAKQKVMLSFENSLIMWYGMTLVAPNSKWGYFYQQSRKATEIRKTGLNAILHRSSSLSSRNCSSVLILTVWVRRQRVGYVDCQSFHRRRMKKVHDSWEIAFLFVLTIWESVARNPLSPKDRFLRPYKTAQSDWPTDRNKLWTINQTVFRPAPDSFR